MLPKYMAYPDVDEGQVIESNPNESDTVDVIMMKEIDDLRHMTNRKAIGTDRINMQLITYGSSLLHFLNMCWKQQMVSREWSVANVTKKVTEMLIITVR